MLSLSVMLAFVACEPEEPVVCPAIFIPSFRLQIVGPDGALPPSLAVTYSLDGGPELALPCLGIGPDKTCPEWVDRTGKPGTFVLSASVPDGTLVGGTTIVVPLDNAACPAPITQGLTITLGPP